MADNKINKHDLICVGGGIMSATLALMVKLIDPKTSVLILEKLDQVSQESSEAWNNSGTGHSAFCEINYTPEQENGSVDISKAISIFEQFEKSKQFWTHLTKNSLITDPQAFIHSVPHHAWVTGEQNVDFLKKRYETMKEHFAFEEMLFSSDHSQLRKWFPLIMQGREPSEVMAATRMEMGTEVNFELLTKSYFKILEEEFDTPVHLAHEVLDVDPDGHKGWMVEAKNLTTNKKVYYDAEHIFIGAGGGALPLLQKVEIPEKKGYGGFPVSGEWLYCTNPDVIKKHQAKVYSKAGVKAPPMSVPHLDTRYINGKQELVFGPFAGFNTKFLKEGSYLDLPKSIRFDNIPSLWGVFWHNLPLVEYLIKEISMKHEDRMEELRSFVKDAKSDDWKLKVAGQRVQIIKKDEEEGGTLEFGTDIVHSKDGKITALLGASPGASTAVHIMIELLQIAFPEKVKENEEKLNEIIPFWNKSIESHQEEFKLIQQDSLKTLKLSNYPL
ncbi:malate dehydrogenase (quinone) [Fulvivirga sediminis]|uniref:Probable malate:quinone oxidoreductase n=1 Tax=Fulvivirga sediminis TaxID=2803949 RepID=A0A937F6Z1_9BACT|nr:malate dehydrogenase (quinone) [Fulvivirga sediminis]MBL3655228.1 malate dehydrogenase (quinone) [Fulvivirga sediminis]